MPSEGLVVRYRWPLIRPVFRNKKQQRPTLSGVTPLYTLNFTPR